MLRFLYDVVTLYDCMQDPATMAWLTQHALNLPESIPPGRYPTPSEINAVLENIPGQKVSYLISGKVWEATISARDDVLWASLAIKDFDGDWEKPSQFFYPAGWDEIIVLVTSHLSRYCGPLVLLPDSGSSPQLVY